MPARAIPSRLVLHLAGAALGPLLLAACATTGAQPGRGAEAAGLRGPVAAGAAEQDGAGRSAYGLYLAGSAALNEGRTEVASRYFDAARREVGAGAETAVDDGAFSAALLAGDTRRAALLAPQAPPTGPGQEAPPAAALGRLVMAVEALAAGKGAAAEPLLTDDQLGSQHLAIGALLRPYAAAEAEAPERALVAPAVASRPWVKGVGALGQAQLFERAGRFDEAETAYKVSAAPLGLPGLTALAYGGFLERRGRWDEAAALYAAALEQTSDDQELLAAAARAQTRRKPIAAPTLKQGEARALTYAAVAMQAERRPDLALAYLRLALRLDPEGDNAWMLVGDILGERDPEAAKAAYARVRPGRSAFAPARARWAALLEEEPEAALALARRTAAEAPASVDAQIVLAEQLRTAKQTDEAVRVLDAARAAKPKDWRLPYLKGVALERAGRWSDAEPALQEAATLAPGQPEVLNYLGYAWVDRGEKVQEGLALVRKAVDARPQDGAIVDSLGWAQYRLGDYKAAVETLERAVGLSAADPEINDHLGDAYWRVGRKVEAGFQWKRVLTLDPEPEMKAAAERKLRDGLPAAPPSAPAAPPAPRA